MTYKQVDLRSEQSRLVCWVAADPRIKPGVCITLKETGERLWYVDWVSQTVSAQHPRKTWKVGGLA